MPGSLVNSAEFLCAAVSRMGSEAAFEVFGRARQLQAEGRDIIHLEIGEPDFDTPAHIKAAGIAAIEANQTHYAPNAGLVELRDAVAEYASLFRGLRTPYARENVVVGPGAKMVIWNLLSALLDPGDEMLYADPAYPTYAAAAGYLGAKAVPVRLLERLNWRLDLDAFLAKITPRTKVVVLNSPHNPTGGVLTREDLQVVADAAQRHNLLVLSDEIYSRNLYSSSFVSIAQLDGMQERTIIVDGFSKAYAMTGWRLGYCLAPAKIAGVMTLMANNTYACVNTFVQRAGVAALQGPDEPVQAMCNTFRERRKTIVEGLNRLPNVTCPWPDGAFYVFPNVTKISTDDLGLAKFLLEEAGVALLGGSSFGPAGAGYLRISYATDVAALERALERMRDGIVRFSS
jgi:aspartate/methionine/tyrosine aminotransferase